MIIQECRIVKWLRSCRTAVPKPVLMAVWAMALV